MAYIRGLNTDRSFRGPSSVDERFLYNVGDEITERLKSSHEITVCDIGCGANGGSIRDMLMLYPGTKGIGLDFQLAKEVEEPRLKLVKGDLFNIDIRDVADVAYCAYLLPDISSTDLTDHENDTAIATINISRTLKQGGKAFIDEGVFSSADYMLDEFREVIERHDPEFNDQFTISNDPLIGLIGNYLIVDRVN